MELEMTVALIRNWILSGVTVFILSWMASLIRFFWRMYRIEANDMELKAAQRLFAMKVNERGTNGKTPEWLIKMPLLIRLIILWPISFGFGFIGNWTDMDEVEEDILKARKGV